jgi:hypothetical protein
LKSLLDFKLTFLYHRSMATAKKNSPLLEFC